ncbi:phage tail tube protein [Bifidobacterium platyrrhinorum]|uniref:Phage tail protein n=1 Tax=Bifidobacterium platyrrhinorum TaxID=2661628 RepID=A0A6L9STN6_9BIFI|nr:hypothetical protein [Bifidobacterium platyrrhinorum]NEG55469.1 hypothetical protein [Bifidobacterium platyrrhinorum]
MALGFHDESVMTAVRGAVFVGNPNQLIDKALLPNITVDSESFGTGAALFENLGHMSEDNLPESNLDGGDATVLGTWANPSFRTRYDQTTGTFTLHAVQSDRDLFKLVYNGVDDAASGGVDFSITKKATNKSLFLLWADTDTNERAGMLLPNVDITFDALPTLNQDSFNQIDISVTVKTSSALNKNADGSANYVRKYFQDAFKTAA